MNLFKQIASRGWLGTALRNLTFGLYPKLIVKDHPDWCTAHSRLYTWSQDDQPAHIWTTGAQPVYQWTAAGGQDDQPAHIWTTGAQPVYQWTAAGGVCE